MGDKQIAMVLLDYWTVEQIQQQQRRLSKQPPKLNPVDVDNEVNATKC